MLCLHGYHGTGAILRRQMAPLAAAIPAGVELVYADAPFVPDASIVASTNASPGDDDAHIPEPPSQSV